MEYSRFIGWGFEPAYFQIKAKGKPECWQNGWLWGNEPHLFIVFCVQALWKRFLTGALNFTIWLALADRTTANHASREWKSGCSHIGTRLLAALGTSRLLCEWGQASPLEGERPQGQSLLSPPSSAGKPADRWMKPSKTTWPTSSLPTDLRHMNKARWGQPRLAYISRTALLTHWLMGSNEYAYFKPLNVGTVCYRAKAKWYTWEQLSLTYWLKIQTITCSFFFSFFNQISIHRLQPFSK